jgi:hypothetical protein
MQGCPAEGGVCGTRVVATRLEYCMRSLSPVEIVFLEDNDFAGWLAVVGAIRSHGPQYHKRQQEPNTLHPQKLHSSARNSGLVKCLMVAL